MHMFEISATAADQQKRCGAASSSTCVTFRTLKSILIWAGLAAAIVLAAPVSAQDLEAPAARHASAALDLAIVIPPILRVLENSHPSILATDKPMPARVIALQRVILISTVRSGFCMDLRLDLRQVSDWQLRLAGNPRIQVEANNGGYRLCARRAGRYELALEHDFMLQASAPRPTSADTAIDWPVNVSLATP